MALKLGDYVVTEAGFGADLGAEKFLDIKCRLAGLTPDAVVVVATVRALKMHGGVAEDRAGHGESGGAGARGCPTCCSMWTICTEVYGLPAVVAINRFPTDTEAELALLRAALPRRWAWTWRSRDVWARGGAGGEELAAGGGAAVRAAEQTSASPMRWSDPLRGEDRDDCHSGSIGGAGVSLHRRRQPSR